MSYLSHGALAVNNGVLAAAYFLTSDGSVISLSDIGTEVRIVGIALRRSARKAVR